MHHPEERRHASRHAHLRQAWPQRLPGGTDGLGRDGVAVIQALQPAERS